MIDLELLIERTLEKYKDAQLNLSAKQARQNLAKEIAKQIKNNL